MSNYYNLYLLTASVVFGLLPLPRPVMISCLQVDEIFCVVRELIRNHLIQDSET